MEQKFLDVLVEDVREVWGPLSTEVVEATKSSLIRLVKEAIVSGNFSELVSGQTPEKELYRDAEHGFVLLAHAEQPGQYRVPHDHGAGWVIYAVLQGEIEMRTYKLVTDRTGKSDLVQRDSHRMLAGDVSVYLPGDIHDTRAVSGSVVMLRFSSVDLKKESREGRMTRYMTESVK